MKVKSIIGGILGIIGFFIILFGTKDTGYDFKVINLHTIFIGLGIMLLGIIVSCMQFNKKQKTYKQIMNIVNKYKYYDKDNAKVLLTLELPELSENSINSFISKYPDNVNTYNNLNIGDKIKYTIYEYKYGCEYGGGIISKMWSDGHIQLDDYTNQSEFDYANYRNTIKKIEK